MFRVGQRVVCVDASNALGSGKLRFTCPLRVGEVYEILEIRTGGGRKYIGLSTTGDPGIFWAHIRFRPVKERKTDIGIFNEILRKVTRKDKVRA